MTLNSNKKKQQIFILFFLVYFIVYAISPLSSSGSFSNGEQISYVQQSSKSSFENVRIYFLNIFLSNFSSEPSQGHATSKILLKKVRAVLHSPDNIKKIPLDIAKISEYFPVFNFTPWFKKENREGAPRLFQNFLSLYSGRSPPSL